MKKINQFLLGIFIFVLFTGCGGDSGTEETEEDVATGKLSNKWVVGTTGEVTRDNTDITPEFSDFSIQFFPSNSYVVREDPLNVIYPTGTWQFNGNALNQILLNDDPTPVTIEFGDDGQSLTMQFTASGDIPLGSKVMGISGDYVFHLVR